MSRKWSSASPRGSVVAIESPFRTRSSSATSQQLQQKLAAVTKASRVVLLEAMQLRWESFFLDKLVQTQAMKRNTKLSQIACTQRQQHVPNEHIHIYMITGFSHAI